MSQPALSGSDPFDDFGGDLPAADSVRVLVATDPICSRCWVMEPAWRKLLHHHGDRLAVRRLYGGLLPRWHHFRDRNFPIEKPADVARHWSTVSRVHGQPIDPSVWLRDPLPSSYPPSIALHVVRHIAPALEASYLRRLRQALFLEARNVAREEVLIACAADVGLEWDSFAAAYQAGAGADAFARGLLTASALGIESLPTLIVRGPHGGRSVVMRGPQPYFRLATALRTALGDELAPEREVTPAEALRAYGTGTLREFAELLGETVERTEVLLLAAGARVDEEASGMVWRGGEGEGTR